MNYEDMNKLSAKDHCDKLMILTAKILDQNLTNLDKKKMVERVKPVENKMKGGQDAVPAAVQEPVSVPVPVPAAVPAAVQEPAPVPAPAAEPAAAPAPATVEPEPVPTGKPATAEPAKKEELAEKKEESAKKEESGEKEETTAELEEDDKEKCMKIAKFYVKIAHLYAAIMKTINPVITTTDEKGNVKKYDLASKQRMPTNAEIQSIQHNNFCTRRLNALLQESDINKTDPKNKILTVKPRFCTMNYDNETKKQRVFDLKGGKNKNDDDEDEDEDDREEKRKKEKGKEKKKEGDDNEDEEDDDDDNKKKNKNKNDNKDKNRDKNTDRDNENDNEDEESDLGKKKNKLNANKGPTKEEEEDNDEKDTEGKKEKEIKPPPVVIKDEKALKEDNTEIGIPELKKLYYDVYDEKTKTFTSMSPDMRKIYEADVAIFYTAFTGEKMKKDENGQPMIKTFDQIPLRDYKKSDGCKPEGIFTKEYEGNLNKQFGMENLFEKYAEHVQTMMQTMNATQNRLLEILNRLFKFNSPNNNNDNNNNNTVGEIIIQPRLDDDELQRLIKTTRKIIVELYSRCEMDFLDGMHIFEAIVATQLAKSTNSQVQLLDQITEEYLEKK
jgi:hypothetical protein